MDAMLVSTLPSCDGRPEHGTKNGLEGSDVSANAFFDQTGEIRHLASIDERRDNFPIGGIPTDEEYLSRSMVSAHGRVGLRTIGMNRKKMRQSSFTTSNYYSVAYHLAC